MVFCWGCSGERRSTLEEHYTPVFKQDGDWWVGYVPNLPGALTQGATLEEAQENMKEAIELILEVRYTMLMSEAVLSREWLTPEEDEAWADL